MGKSKTKPIRCYGLFYNNIKIADLDPFTAQMAVTSFGRTFKGDHMMAHGHSLPTRQSEHRKAEGMYFYASRERMEAAIVNANRISSSYDVEIERLEAKLADLQRQRRVATESALSKYAFQPAELQYDA